MWGVFGLSILLDHLGIDPPFLPYIYGALCPAAITVWEANPTSSAGNIALLIYTSLLNGGYYLLGAIIIKQVAGFAARSYHRTHT